MRTSETDGPLEKRAADRRPRCHVRVLEFFRVVVERIVVGYCGFGVVESVAQPHRLKAKLKIDVLELRVTLFERTLMGKA